MSEHRSNDLELAVLIGDELRIFDLSAGSEVSLGRDAINQIQIDHPSVSRRHAVLHLGPPLVIEDLGSANGTFVHDGTPLGGSLEPAAIRRALGRSHEPAFLATIRAHLDRSAGMVLRLAARDSLRPTLPGLWPDGLAAPVIAGR